MSGARTAAVGVVGIGAMGLAMALRLVERGHAVVVHDTDPSRAPLAPACAVAGSSAAVAARCATLIVAVADAAQTDAVLFGANGAAAAMTPGDTVILCPTIGPADTERCAGRLAERGVDTLDAPMSGGPARARAGTMSLMVAGADAVVERQAALLSDLAQPVVRLGTRIGDGARTKLVNNALAAVHLAAAAEAMALAVRVGLDPAHTLAVIEASSGQSWIGSDRIRRALAGDDTVRAQTALLAKDSALALAMARAAGAPLPLGEGAAAVFAAACGDGLAAADDSVLVRRALAAPR